MRKLLIIFGGLVFSASGLKAHVIIDASAITNGTLPNARLDKSSVTMLGPLTTSPADGDCIKYMALGLLRSGACDGAPAPSLQNPATGFFNMNGFGIGTSSSISLVYNDNSFNQGLTIRNTNAGTTALTGATLNNSGGTSTGQFVWVPANYADATLANSILFSSIGNVKLAFVSAADNVANPDIYFKSGNKTPAIYINGTRNYVGLLTATPSSLLDVYGGSITVRDDGTGVGGGIAASSASIKNLFTIGSGPNFRANSGGQGVFNGTASSTQPALGGASANFQVLGGGGVGLYGLTMGVMGSGNGYIQQQRVDGSATAFNLQVQAMGGSVVIGTPTTPTARLEVMPNANSTRGMIVHGDNNASSTIMEIQTATGTQLSYFTKLGYLAIPQRWDADTLATTRGYVISKGQNLIPNGSGLLGNNYNFSSFTFDPVETHGGGGSFKINVNQQGVFSNELIPVDVQKTYRLVAWGKSGDTGGANFNAGNLQYLGISEFDADGNSVAPIYSDLKPGAAQTTLAQTLTPGDTSAILTDATGWYTGADAFDRGFVWYPYTNAKGYTYPNYTYSRNTTRLYNPTYSGASGGAWPAGGITGNTINLTAPWPVGAATLPAGTLVANFDDAGTFKYIAAVNVTIPNDWTRYEGKIGTPQVAGVEDTHKFRAGTAFLELLFLVNYHAAADNNVRWSDLWFSELSSDNLESASATAAGVVALANQSMGTGDKYFGGKIGVGTTGPSSGVDVAGSSLTVRPLFGSGGGITSLSLNVGPGGFVSDTNGNFGVGTDTAVFLTAKLEISSANAVRNAVLLQATTGYYGNRNKIFTVGTTSLTANVPSYFMKGIEVGTTTPLNFMDVNGDAVIRSSLSVINTGLAKWDLFVGTESANYQFAIDSATGHFILGAGSPTIANCGTIPNGALISGTDQAGTVQVGGGITVLSCDLVFQNPFKNIPGNPACVFSDNNSAVAIGWTSISNTGFTASFGASLVGGKFTYHCDGVKE